MARHDDRSARKLEHLKAILGGKRALLAVTQNYPDPDAVAAAAALRELAHHLAGIPTTIASGGMVGRAENRALVKYLDLPVYRLREIDFSRFDCIALVDTQPKTGNNSLPPEANPDIVIDHHPIRRATRSAPFTDIRSRYGATSTILYEYLHEEGVEIGIPLATALVYGIRSDTQDLGREAHKQDIDAILALYPVANKRMLGEIQSGNTPRSYFRMLEAALRNAKVYRDCVIASVEEIDIPDIVGEIADLMLRDEQSYWALAYGYHENYVLLSLRTADRAADAGKVMRRIVRGMGAGGGHKTMAGGQIPLENGQPGKRKKIEDTIRDRMLRALRIQDREGEKLVKR